MGDEERDSNEAYMSEGEASTHTHTHSGRVEGEGGRDKSKSPEEVKLEECKWQ